MADDITLTLLQTTAEFDGASDQHTWPMRVEAVSTIAGLSSKIFVYHATMGADQWRGDNFDCVASVQQMSLIPEDAPVKVEGGVVPYYRKNIAEVWFSSPEALAECWADIQVHVQDLIDNYRATLTLAANQTVVLS